MCLAFFAVFTLRRSTIVPGGASNEYRWSWWSWYWFFVILGVVLVVIDVMASHYGY